MPEGLRISRVANITPRSADSHSAPSGTGKEEQPPFGFGRRRVYEALRIGVARLEASCFGRSLGSAASTLPVSAVGAFCRVCAVVRPWCDLTKAGGGSSAGTDSAPPGRAPWPAVDAPVRQPVGSSSSPGYAYESLRRRLYA